MELYLFKSACCMAILYGLYLLFLERESMHNFKRFYLLGSLALSFIIPAITVTQLVEFTPSNAATVTITNNAGDAIAPINYNWITTGLWSIYLLGVALFSIRFFKNLRQLWIRIKSNPRQKGKQISYVLLRKLVIPHTFFSYIFVNKKGFEDHEIPTEVLVHEQAHATQKHSVDILFAELLQLLFWFNPLIYLYKRSIKLNHEFLADKAVLEAGFARSNYQETLLHYSVSANGPSLANAINYSSIKKRFTVMKHTSSKRTRLVKGMFILPVIAFLGYSFSTTNTVVINTQEPEVTIEELRATNHPTYSDFNRWQDKNTYTLLLDNTPIANAAIKEYHPDDLPFFSEFSVANQSGAKHVQVNLMTNPFWQSQIGVGFVTPKQQEAIIEEALYSATDPIKIVINGKSITVNGNTTTLKYFAKAVDKATKTWTDNEYKNADIKIQISNVDSAFIKKLNDVYKTTKLYQASPNKYGLVPPPPPPPPAPVTVTEVQEVILEEIEMLPNSENEFIEIEEVEEFEEIKEVIEIKTEPQNGQNVFVEIVETPTPPPPPPPLSVTDAIVKLAKEGAKFMLNGKEITSDRALELAKKDALNTIDVVKKNGKRTVVNLKM